MADTVDSAAVAAAVDTDKKNTTMKLGANQFTKHYVGPMLDCLHQAANVVAVMDLSDIAAETIVALSVVIMPDGVGQATEQAKLAHGLGHTFLNALSEVGAESQAEFYKEFELLTEKDEYAFIVSKLEDCDDWDARVRFVMEDAAAKDKDASGAPAKKRAKH